MITVLHGENSFEIRHALAELTGAYEGEVERVDGSTLELRDLPDILAGGTLFTQKRLVVLKNVSENKHVWEVLPDWLDRLSDDVSLVLVENKIDKRTKTYKTLQKAADMQEFAAWTERDGGKAEQWLLAEVKQRGVALDRKLAQLLVRRSGVNQWRLHNDLEKLAVFDEITPELIEEVIASHPTESVFELFEAALRGNRTRLAEMMTTLKVSEDPYKIFGLLSGQVLQLAALSLSDGAVDQVAKDFGAHPFALRKLAPYANKVSRSQMRQIVAAFDTADERMKTSGVDPWLAIERALSSVAHVQ